MTKSQDTNFNILRTKRTIKKAFFYIFKVAKNCLRPESAPLMGDIPREMLNDCLAADLTLLKKTFNVSFKLGSFPDSAT